MISFYCIQETFIEHHIFRASDMERVRLRQRRYGNSKFIDYFKTNSTLTYRRFGEILMILSEERDRNGNMYRIHVFSINNDVLAWIDRFSINTNGRKLRDENPMLNFPNSPYIAFIDSTELSVFVVADSKSRADHYMKFTKRVRYAFLTLGNLAYFTHYEGTKISAYEVHEVYNEQLRKIELTTDKQ